MSYISHTQKRKKTHIRLRTLRITLICKTLPHTESIPLILSMLRASEERRRRDVRIRPQRVNWCNTARCSSRDVLTLWAHGGCMVPRGVPGLLLGCGFRDLRSWGLVDRCSKWLRGSRAWVIVSVPGSRGLGLRRSNGCLGRSHHECDVGQRGWR